MIEKAENSVFLLSIHIGNMNRWVKEMQKNDMRIKRNKFFDSVFTLVLDAALIYGIVILAMRIFL